MFNFVGLPTIQVYRGGVEESGVSVELAASRAARPRSRVHDGLKFLHQRPHVDWLLE